MYIGERLHVWTQLIYHVDRRVGRISRAFYLKWSSCSGTMAPLATSPPAGFQFTAIHQQPWKTPA